MNIGFALTFDDEATRFVVETENRVHDLCHFVSRLGCDTNIPHLTLYQGPLSFETPIRRIVRCAAREVRELHLSDTVEFLAPVYKPPGWFFYGAAHTPELMGLESTVLHSVEQFIVYDRAHDPDIPYYTDGEREAYGRYRYRYAHDAYLPHITIGRSENVSETSVSATLDILTRHFPPLSAHPAYVVCYVAGHDGTCERIMYRTRIGGDGT